MRGLRYSRAAACDEACAGLAEEILRNRFHGFLLASCRPEAGVKALRAVSRGELWLAAHAAGQRHRWAGARKRARRGGRAASPLARRGHEEPHATRGAGGRLLRQGLTNKEIARSLGVMEDTVKKHLQSVFAKLGVHRRALVVLCRAAGASGRA